MNWPVSDLNLIRKWLPHPSNANMPCALPASLRKTPSQLMNAAWSRACGSDHRVWFFRPMKLRYAELVCGACDNVDKTVDEGATASGCLRNHIHSGSSPRPPESVAPRPAPEEIACEPHAGQR